MTKLMLAAAAAALGSALAIAPAAAQTAPNRYSVGTHIGRGSFGTASALEATPLIGIDASYRLPMFKGSTDVGVGFTFIASRPKTDGTQFPVVAFDFGDTTFLYTVAQRTTLLQYGVQAQLGQSLGPVRLFGMGGGGFYTFLLDARQTLGNHRFTKPMVFGGGGLEYAVRRDIGLRVQVQDMVMTSFDRQRLDPTVKYSQDRRIMDVLPPPVAAKSTIHNLQTAIVFSYVPSRQIIGGGEQP